MKWQARIEYKSGAVEFFRFMKFDDFRWEVENAPIPPDMIKEITIRPLRAGE